MGVNSIRVKQGTAFRGSWLLVICAGLLAVACQSSAVVSAPSEAAPVGASGVDEAGEIAIHVASNGWHSAIVFSRADLPPGFVPEAADFPGASYLSFGWGDAEYFPARDPSFGMMLRAGIQPTPSVIHVSGLRSHPLDAYAEGEVLSLRISAQGFRKPTSTGALLETAPRARHRSGPGCVASADSIPPRASSIFSTLATHGPRGG